VNMFGYFLAFSLAVFSAFLTFFIISCGYDRMVVFYNQWLAADVWFSSGTPVSSTNITDCNDITEMLLKVVLNTIALKLPYDHNHNSPLIHEGNSLT
jgi:hypothetical protein